MSFVNRLGCCPSGDHRHSGCNDHWFGIHLPLLWGHKIDRIGGKINTIGDRCHHGRIVRRKSFSSYKSKSNWNNFRKNVLCQIKSKPFFHFTFITTCVLTTSAPVNSFFFFLWYEGTCKSHYFDDERRWKFYREKSANCKDIKATIFTRRVSPPFCSSWCQQIQSTSTLCES